MIRESGNRFSEKIMCPKEASIERYIVTCVPTSTTLPLGIWK